MTFILICMLSILFMNFSNPLSKGYMLLLLTIMTSMSTTSMHLDSWFGYILFLIMVGGLLVTFIYMTSVASNEKFNFPKFMILKLSGIIMLMTLVYFLVPWTIVDFSSMMMNQETMIPKLSMYLKKIFNYPLGQLPIALMSYLFLTLIMVAKMTEFAKGPIRQK
uniref:NADH-ubiquinone oxidoreductase chain 6 n=1 Tax=Scolytinae sp. BMNH 1039965 TaxID=1903771 RepID=A0A343A4L9_9CUCU|nr:NADH dehydrogenase subunit 6 [Scolytinae sp. BMNH 1039965]